MPSDLSRRTFLAGLAAAAAAPAARPETAAGPPFRFGDARDWFFRRRFGLFVHWGLYAVPGWHEQHMYRRRMSRAEYAALISQFNPRRFDPDAWLDAAAAAGMGYVTFTAKHIDGFCMWRTRQTDFNVTRTPFGRDALGELAAACQRRDVPLCVYYACADMHHPNYPSAGRPYELPAPEPGDEPDLDRYLAYVRAQMRELCTGYGPIHGVWWDANVLKHRDPSINADIRRWQPAAVINNRGYDDGDFGTPERDWDPALRATAPFDRPVEACQSVGHQSWGWRRDEDYYSAAHLIRSIHGVLARGGNYLLNVGPTDQGAFPDEAVQRLRAIGAWLSRVRTSLFDAEPIAAPARTPGLAWTRRGATLYAHLLRDPEGAWLTLHPLAELPRRARLLNTGQPLACDVADLPRHFKDTPPRALRLRGLPEDGASTAGWVVELEFERPSGAAPPPR